MDACQFETKFVFYRELTTTGESQATTSQEQTIPAASCWPVFSCPVVGSRVTLEHSPGPDSEVRLYWTLPLSPRSRSVAATCRDMGLGQNRQVSGWSRYFKHRTFEIKFN